MTGPTLDPYTATAQDNEHTLQEKIKGLQEIIKAARVGMLTTRSTDGSLHSRAMTPAAPKSETQLTLVFLANNTSHKFEEIENDANVNVSFTDTSTAWASFSGKAKVSRDQELIDKYWSSYVSAYFGDLKDGKHKGNAADERVSVIQVFPDEIRYWAPTKTAISRAIDAGFSAMTGRTSAPGEIRTITKNEIEMTESINRK